MTDKPSRIRIVGEKEAGENETGDSNTPAPGSPEGLFTTNYIEIRDTASKSTPGVALIAIDTRSTDVVGATWIGRDVTGPTSLIVGRHQMCDMVLSDDSVSLRHIVALVPWGSARLAEFSLHDLHTGQGFSLEGESVLAATVSRFGVMQLGPYMLFCFATGVDGAWGESAAGAWVELGGEAKAVDHQSAGLSAEALRESVRNPRRRSYITMIAGPLRSSDELLKPGEERVAMLRIRSGERVDKMALGASALERGVLIGRAHRCATTLNSMVISRVHVLVIALDGEVVAVDTASTSGIFVDRKATRRARVVMLSRGGRATLANEDASVSLQ